MDTYTLIILKLADKKWSVTAVQINDTRFRHNISLGIGRKHADQENKYQLHFNFNLKTKFKLLII